MVGVNDSYAWQVIPGTKKKKKKKWLESLQLMTNVKAGWPARQTNTVTDYKDPDVTHESYLIWIKIALKIHMYTKM